MRLISWACAIFVRRALQSALIGRPFDEGLERFGQRMEFVAALLPRPSFVSFQSETIRGISCEWVVDSRAPDSAPVILYLHGGGFVTGSNRTHRDTAWRLGRASAAKVLLVNYRLAPAHPFPAARNDVLEVLEVLGQIGLPASKIALAGDSAGANLAMSVALHMANNGCHLAGLVCFSPWLDLAKSHLMRAEESMLTPDFLRHSAAAYAGDAQLADPRLSPLNADLSNLPPLHVSVAKGEILEEDAVRVVERARLAGRQAQLHIVPRQVHAFPTFAAVNPRAREALAKAGSFLQGLFDGHLSGREPDRQSATVARRSDSTQLTAQG